MLNRVVIENFRSLVHVDVPLRPLTVLIGKNDSGKSTFLRALGRVCNSGPSYSLIDYNRNVEMIPIRITGTTENGNIVMVGPEGLTNLDATLVPAFVVQLPVQGVSMVSVGYDEQTGGQLLESDGSGVPSLLDHFLRRDRRRFSKILEEFKRQIDGLDDIEIVTPRSHLRRLDLVLEEGFRIPADEASAGVRILLFFIALTFHRDPPKVILLEEPETGLHPKRLAEVIRLLREITQGTHGRHATQVILTTHSPYLLDSIDLETDQVLVFHRNPDGSRSAEPADRERLSLFLDEFQLGEVWFNQGEEGLVKR